MKLLETASLVCGVALVFVLVWVGVREPFSDWMKGEFRGALHYVRLVAVMMAPFAIGLCICVAIARRRGDGSN